MLFQAGNAMDGKNLMAPYTVSWWKSFTMHTDILLYKHRYIHTAN